MESTNLGELSVAYNPRKPAVNALCEALVPFGEGR